MKKDDLAYPGEAFLAATQSELRIIFDRNAKYFPGDEEPRDIYICILTRGGQDFDNVYQFEFGQSIANEGIPPTTDEVLGCIETYMHACFHDFCDDFGYDGAERSSMTVYEAVKEQAKALASMYNEEELELLREARG